MKEHSMLAAALAAVVMGWSFAGCVSNQDEQLVRPMSCSTHPDYRVPFLSSPDGSARVGDTIQLSYRVSNACKSATIQTYTRVYLCTNPAVLQCQWLSDSTAPLARGAVTNFNKTATVPACAVVGVTNYIVAFADADHVLAEYLENNNTAVKALFISP